MCSNLFIGFDFILNSRLEFHSSSMVCANFLISFLKIIIFYMTHLIQIILIIRQKGKAFRKGNNREKCGSFFLGVLYQFEHFLRIF